MLKNKKTIASLLIGSLALTTLPACETIEENPRTSGAVIGGLGGATAGALIGGDNAVLGALIGGALGAGGGYLIGSTVDNADDEENASDANRRAQSDPVTAEQARNARTADINNDGYVTMDEVVAMEQAGLSNQEMIDRLDATNQFFELTREQERYLRDHGVDQEVIVAMRTINQDVRQDAVNRYSDRLGGRSGS